MLLSKWENLSRCSKKLTCSQNTTSFVGLEAEEIFFVNIEYIIFLKIWAWFLRGFFVFLKKFWKNIKISFIALYFHLFELKRESQNFKILFQTGNINIFVLRGVFYGKYV